MNSWLHVGIKEINRKFVRRKEHCTGWPHCAHGFLCAVNMKVARVYKSSNEVWSAERKELGGCLASTCSAFVYVDMCMCVHSFLLRLLAGKCLFVSLLCLSFWYIFILFVAILVGYTLPNALKCHSLCAGRLLLTLSLSLSFSIFSFIRICRFPKKNTSHSKH